MYFAAISKKHPQENADIQRYAQVHVVAVVWRHIQVSAFTGAQRHFQVSPLNYDCSSFAKDHNFEARMTYGNRNKNGITIAHWNAGHGFLHNKMDEICQIMNETKPMILGISESCLQKSHDVANVEIENYKVVFSKTLQNPSIDASRIAVYFSPDLTVI